MEGVLQKRLVRVPHFFSLSGWICRPIQQKWRNCSIRPTPNHFREWVISSPHLQMRTFPGAGTSPLHEMISKCGWWRHRLHLKIIFMCDWPHHPHLKMLFAGARHPIACSWREFAGSCLLPGPLLFVAAKATAGKTPAPKNPFYPLLKRFCVVVAADLVSIIDPLMYMYQYDDHLYGTEGVKNFFSLLLMNAIWWHITYRKRSIYSPHIFTLSA
jgi:hypothetical protein